MNTTTPETLDMIFDEWPRLMQDVYRALERGGSPYTLLDVTRWWESGDLVVYQSPCVSASWSLSKREVVHLGGKWCSDCVKNAQHAMEGDIGPDWTWRGRRGWPRFLKMKGFKV